MHLSICQFLPPALKVRVGLGSPEPDHGSNSNSPPPQTSLRQESPDPKVKWNADPGLWRSDQDALYGRMATFGRTPILGKPNTPFVTEKEVHTNLRQVRPPLYICTEKRCYQSVLTEKMYSDGTTMSTSCKYVLYNVYCCHTPSLSTGSVEI